MSYLTLRYNRVFEYLDEFKSEYLGLYFSFFLHFLILFFAIGLPDLFGPKKILVPSIIPIEIITIDNVTSIPKKINDSTNKETNNIKLKVKEKKFNSSDNQKIKKIDIKKKPEIKEDITDKNNLTKETKNINFKDKKEFLIEEEKKKIEINEKNYENSIKKLKPKLKPQNQVKKIDKISKSDVDIQDKPMPKPLSEFNIASMLKDLRNEKTVKSVESEIEEKKDNTVENISDQKNNQNAKLTISETDLLLQQLRGCNKRDSGMKRPKGLYVNISARIRPDRTVIQSSIQIVDTNIIQSDPMYLPITESAMRVLLHPECSILKLPEEKYEQWKKFTLRFDDQF